MMRFRHELMEAYTATYDFTFQPVTFTPYGQTFEWSRFDNGDGFSMAPHAFWELQIGNFFTKVKENAKTCQTTASTIHYTGSASPVCSYNDDKVTEYYDPVWKYNVGSQLLKLQDSMGSWYGARRWY